MPYQHILVAVDLTEECDPVVTRAQKLAKASGQDVSGAYRRTDGHGLRW